MFRSNKLVVWEISIVIFSASLALGATASNTPREDQIKLQLKLSKIHQEAANCLKAGTPMDECSKKLKESCPAAMYDECVSLSEAEVSRHRKTHEMAGTVGKGTPDSH